jgi:peptidoglycan/xylan/chitin deacetylase (PgdA/CDA1 family)
MSSLFRYIIPIRRATYASLGFFDRAVLRTKNPVFIISYHSVANDTWRFSVDEEQVKKQILFLQKNFKVISLKNLLDFINGKKAITKPSVVLTFDDGYKDILKLKSFFDKQKIKPAIFILADNKHANVSEMKTKRPFLTTKEIKSLKKAGWEIGCHSATHANLSELTLEKLEKEVHGAKKDLEKELGFSIPFFAYPRGKYNKDVLKNVKKANFVLGLTMDDGTISRKSDVLALPRIGVDRTHTFSEFTNTFSPSVVKLRAVIKKSPAGKYL